MADDVSKRGSSNRDRRGDAERHPLSSIVQRAIEFAQKRLGMEEFARQIGAPPTIIAAWRIGAVAVPDATFLRVIELVTALDPNFWLQRRAGKDRRRELRS
jgi:hypothetical protein